MRDTGWQPAIDVPGAVWRELSEIGDGLNARLVARPTGEWSVLQSGIVHDFALSIDAAKAQALECAVVAIRRERDRLNDTLKALDAGSETP